MSKIHPPPAPPIEGGGITRWAGGIGAPPRSEDEGQADGPEFLPAFLTFEGLGPERVGRKAL